MKLNTKFETRGTTAAEPVAGTGGPDHVSPAARNLALAHRLAQIIDKGLIADYTAAAKLLGVSQPRLTHLMALTLLAPQVQEAILAGTVALTDKQLRRLSRMPLWSDQLAAISRG